MGECNGFGPPSSRARAARKVEGPDGIATARRRMELARLADTLTDDPSMTRTPEPRSGRGARRAAILATIVLAAAAACGDGSKHATDGDTGAAAPATVRDMSATPNAPDSTAGVASPTGQPNVAGDTTSARARDTTKGAATGASTSRP